MGIGQCSSAIASCTVSLVEVVLGVLVFSCFSGRVIKRLCGFQRNLEVLQKVLSNTGMGSSCLKKIPREFSGQSQSHVQSNPLVCGYMTIVGSRKIPKRSWVICSSSFFYSYKSGTHANNKTGINKT